MSRLSVRFLFSVVFIPVSIDLHVPSIIYSLLGHNDPYWRSVYYPNPWIHANTIRTKDHWISVILYKHIVYYNITGILFFISWASLVCSPTSNSRYLNFFSQCLFSPLPNKRLLKESLNFVTVNSITYIYRCLQTRSCNWTFNLAKAYRTSSE